MPRTQVGELGRVLRILLEPDEDVIASLRKVARQEQLAWASITLRGELREGQLVLGRRIYSRATHDPDLVSFHEERQVLGTGEIRPEGDNGYEIELRCTVARQKEVFVGDLLSGIVGARLHVVMIEATS